MFGCLIALLTTVLMAGGSSPDIAARITDLGDGSIGLSYEVRDGVTGNGRGVRVRLGADSTASFYQGHYADLDDLTEEGPAHLTLRVRNGAVVDLDVVVGGSGKQARRADVDLGTVDPAVAARWLMGLVEMGKAKVADDAILAAAIARDVEIVEPFLSVTRDRECDADVRSSALYWLVIVAGERMLGDVQAVIDDDDEDVEVRENAIFALAQLGEGESLEHLMGIARDHRDPRLRQSALFALAQFEDKDEVVALLEEILTE
ncbi:MAG: HEAT repeat domain-containing protein [bacterium]|nr:HEAT repeat domain-containing protein [bacterium]